jgi:hypothetical protein
MVAMHPPAIYNYVCKNSGAFVAFAEGRRHLELSMGRSNAHYYYEVFVSPKLTTCQILTAGQSAAVGSLLVAVTFQEPYLRR